VRRSVSARDLGPGTSVLSLIVGMALTEIPQNAILLKVF